ncbi:acyl-ACP desaturase [Streptomyces griseocarneus]|nr:acyl-ACP desaturase [Streptomyces griseocarneus]
MLPPLQDAGGPMHHPRQDEALLRDLEPVVAANLDRHLAAAKEWFPHQYVPWGLGRDFDGPLGGCPWEAGQSPLPGHVRAALVLSLLTEDNLPSYHAALVAEFGLDGAWGTWIRRWTAEEDRHGTALRAYLHATRAVDPVSLERDRMRHLGAGYTSAYPGSVLHSIAYVTVQEQATRVCHRTLGRISGDPVCTQMLTRISADENLHMVFYRNLLAEAFTRDPNRTMCALWDVIRNFRLPSHDAPVLRKLALRVVMSGIHDHQVLHDQILLPLVRSFKVLQRDDVTGEGARSRDQLAGHMGRLGARAEECALRRLERAAEDGAG